MEQLQLPPEYWRGMVEVPTIDARAEIARLHTAGLDDASIARSLNVRSIPTSSGRGRWHPETVLRVRQPERWAEYMRRYRARRSPR